MVNAVRPPAIWMILIAAFLDMMAMGIVMPVLPGLIEDLTGSLAAAGIWTGLIGSLWALMQFVCAPVCSGRTRSMRRQTLIDYVSKLPACVVAMEACCGAHYLGRLFAAHGHEIKLMPPEYVRPSTPPEMTGNSVHEPPSGAVWSSILIGSGNPSKCRLLAYGASSAGS